VDGAAGELELSMILKWYGPDFGTKRQLLDFLAAHLPEGMEVMGVGGEWVCHHRCGF